MSALWGSIRLYVFGAALLAMIGGLGYLHHSIVQEGVAKQMAKDAKVIARLTAENATALAANTANMDTLAQVQASQAQCEAGRVHDAAQQAAALAARAKAAAQLTRQAAATRAKLDAILAGRCRDWAAQAACGVVAPRE